MLRQRQGQGHGRSACSSRLPLPAAWHDSLATCTWRCRLQCLTARNRLAALLAESCFARKADFRTSLKIQDADAGLEAVCGNNAGNAAARNMLDTLSGPGCNRLQSKKEAGICFLLIDAANSEWCNNARMTEAAFGARHGARAEKEMHIVKCARVHICDVRSL